MALWVGKIVTLSATTEALYGLPCTGCLLLAPWLYPISASGEARRAPNSP